MRMYASRYDSNAMAACIDLIRRHPVVVAVVVVVLNMDGRKAKAQAMLVETEEKSARERE